MAITKDTSFIGTIGSLSYVKVQGIDGIVVRRKGGANKKMIKTSPIFANTRKNNKEWSGCSKAGAAIRHALHPIKHLANSNGIEIGRTA